MNRWILVMTMTSLVTVVGSLASAQRVPTEQSIDQTVERLIEQLDSPRFSIRARATNELQRMGPAAIKPLENVVLRGSSEAAERALAILKQNFNSDSQQLSALARESLQRIAETENHPSASPAQRILNPPQRAPKTNTPRGRVPMLAVPMNRQIQVQIKSVNGQREIKVTLDGREFQFSENDNGIAVQRPDGKGGVKKDRYQNKDELKKKDPEAFKIYDQYAGRGNPLQIQLGDPFDRAFRGFPFPARPQLRPRRALPELQPRPAPPRQEPKPKLDDPIEV